MTPDLLKSATEKGLLVQGSAIYERDLFGNDLQPLPKKITGLSPTMQEWLARKKKTDLHITARLLYEAGTATDGVDALQRIDAQTQSRDQVPLALSDFKGYSRPNWQRQATRTFGTDHIGEADPYRTEGVQKHYIAAKLFTRPLSSTPHSSTDTQLALGLDIHTSSYPSQLPFPEAAQPPSTHDRRQVVAEIADHTQQLRSILADFDQIFGESTNHHWEKHQATGPTAQRLKTLLEQLAGPSVNKLVTGSEGVFNYAALAGLMELGALAQFADSNLCIPFTEIKVSPPGSFLSGGRIDLIQVRQPNGHPLPDSYDQQLTAMQGIRRPHPDLVAALQDQIGDHDQRFLDFKFSRGDAPENRTVILPEQVARGPQQKDLLQMIRYTTLTPLNLAARRVHNGEPLPKDWLSDPRFSQGDIIYAAPERDVIVHNVTVGPQERQRFLDHYIAPRIPKAAVQARVREVDRIIPELIRESKRQGQTKQFAVPDQGVQLPLRLNTTEKTNAAIKGEIHRLRRERTYINDERTLEQTVNGKGEPFYLLHLDEAIRAGYFGEDLDFSRRRAICCPFPDHDDGTPSCSVYFDAGNFYCFRCEKGGRIARESVPENMADLVKFVNRSVVYNPGDRILPDEITRLLTQAQQILQRTYQTDPRGKHYLSEARSLDPDLAFHNGAGLANLSLLDGLFDCGYTIAEMAQAGFVGFSEKIPENSSLANYLRRRGLADKDFSQVIRIFSGTEGTTKEVRAYPYAPMGDGQQPRVTFPTESQDPQTGLWTIDNFYGRATWACERTQAHRKLSITGGTLHGASGAQDAIESDFDQIVVVEAKLDELSLKQLGFQPVTSIIGVNNSKVLDMLAASQKDILQALDNDKTGDEKSENMRVQLRKRGYTGKFRPFTHEFAQAHPAFRGVKDWNAWLQLITRKPAVNSMWRKSVSI